MIMRFLKTIKQIQNRVEEVGLCVVGCLFYLKSKYTHTTVLSPANDYEDDVIILANGPSKKDIQLDAVDRGKYIFACVNDYPTQTEEFFKLKPEYLFLFDPAYFDFVIKGEEATQKKILDNLEKVNWQLTIVMPSEKKLPINNSNIQYERVNTFSIIKNRPLKITYWLYKNNLANFGYQNVVLGALYYFITRKYKKIYLCGVDISDFKNLYVDEQNRTYVDSTHYYGSTRKYFDEMKEYGFTVFWEILLAYQKMFYEFSLAQQYAENMKVEIFNLSEHSYVDSFPKLKPYKIYNKDL